MKILKFGGTSLGNTQRIKTAAGIASSNGNCIVVCSAMGKITDKLEDVAMAWKNNEIYTAINKLKYIENEFKYNCHELFKTDSLISNITTDIHSYFEQALNLFYNEKYTEKSKNFILSIGELVTSYIFKRYLSHTGTKATLISAFDLIRLNEDGEPVLQEISYCADNLTNFKNSGIFVTQGYICLDSQGDISNLNRGGSDYTATLLGAAFNAESVEIWTDIDGLHNNDPRHVHNTTPIRDLSFNEASELAYFGAKVLHPSCIWPAMEKNVPVYLKNTFNPRSSGTCINSSKDIKGIKAIAAKDQITIIRITSGRMMNAYGFLKKIFETFHSCKIPVDVVTTSEVSVSVTIEKDLQDKILINKLEKLGYIDIEYDQCIVCVVGDILKPGNVAEIINTVKHFDIRMISMGASSNNVTLVLPQNQKSKALKTLHTLFNNQKNLSQKSCLQTHS